MWKRGHPPSQIKVCYQNVIWQSGSISTQVKQEEEKPQRPLLPMTYAAKLQHCLGVDLSFCHTLLLLAASASPPRFFQAAFVSEKCLTSGKGITPCSVLL